MACSINLKKDWVFVVKRVAQCHQDFLEKLPLWCTTLRIGGIRRHPIDGLFNKSAIKVLTRVKNKAATKQKGALNIVLSNTDGGI